MIMISLLYHVKTAVSFWLNYCSIIIRVGQLEIVGWQGKVFASSCNISPSYLFSYVFFFSLVFVKKIFCFENMSFLTIMLYQTSQISCLGIFHYIILFLVALHGIFVCFTAKSYKSLMMEELDIELIVEWRYTFFCEGLWWYFSF